MRVVKSIVRWFFGLQAAILMLRTALGIYGILTLNSRVPTAPVVSTHLSSNLTTITGFFLLGAVFAMAWWTARKPSAGRCWWCIAASLLFLGEGIVYFVVVRRYAHSGPVGTLGLDLIAVGVAGLYVFLRSENVPDPAIAVPRRSPIAGDRTSVWTRHATTALAYIAQIGAIVVWTMWAHSHHLILTRGLPWIALVIFGSILTTVVHECGHAILAWCFEMGLVSFKASPFQWAKRQGKWRFKFHPAGLLTAGGAVGAIPTNPEQPRWEEIVMIAAGPIANMLIGVPAIWAVMHDSWASYPQTWEFIAFTGSFCVIGAVLNLFPFMSKDGAYSDGARILQILTHSPLDDYHRTLAGIASTTITARRYRDLDVAAIERAASLFPNEIRGLHLNLCACHFYEDCGQPSEAAAALARAEAIYNDFSVDLPNPLHTIFVIGHACLNREPAAARLWWNRMEAKKGERSNVDYWLAKTALHWVEGDLREAEEAWQKADSEARSLPQFGAYEFDRFRCALLRKALDNPSQPERLTVRPASPPGVAKTILSRVAAVAVAPLSPRSMDSAVDRVLNPLDRIFSRPAPPPPVPDPIAPAALTPARFSHSQADPPAMDALPITRATIFPFPKIAPPPIPTFRTPPEIASCQFPAVCPPSVSAPLLVPAVSSTFSEELASPTTEAAVSRALASFTRIPASSVIASENSLARVSVLPSGSALPTLPSTGVPPSLNAPAVPSAFARRPVRPVPAPPSNFYAEPDALGVDGYTASPDLTAAATPAFTLNTLIDPTQASLAAPALRPVMPPPPSAREPALARFDPLESIRAAALENAAPDRREA